MKCLLVFTVVMLAFMPSVSAKHKKRDIHAINTAKNPVVEKKLDSIVYPTISVKDAEVETLLTEISRWSTTFDKEGKGLKITFSRRKYTDHKHKDECVKVIPRITLKMTDATLRQLLDAIARKSGCSYHTVKEHIEFIHVPMKK